MAATTRTKAERENDLAEMASLLARGATQRQLAERFSLSPGTISYDVKTIEKRWRDSAAEDVAEWKGRVLARHGAVIEEAWVEWERSKSDSEKMVEITELVEAPPVPEEDSVADPAHEPMAPKYLEVTRRTMTTEGQTGDPRYLSVIETALAEQAKILGVHAVEKINVSGSLRREYVIVTADETSLAVES